MKIFPDLAFTGLPPKTFLDWIVAFLMDTAVLYYVSCCLLLLGTYSIMHSPLPGGLLMGYYESYGLYLGYVVLLTVLCLLVFRRLALIEDGLVMAALALFLVLDPAFFNNVFYTYNLSVGLEVNSFFGLDKDWRRAVDEEDHCDHRPGCRIWRRIAQNSQLP